MHDFWLCREGERPYGGYMDLVRRKDAPARLPDDLIVYMRDAFSWIPTITPPPPTLRESTGLNQFGPTIINRQGSRIFQHVCSAWVQLFSQGPEHLRLSRGLTIRWPYEELERVMRFPQLIGELGEVTYFEVQRDPVVAALSTLAQFGEQAAIGQTFILHLGE